LFLAMAGDMRRRIRAQGYTLGAQTLFTSALVPALGVKGAAIALALQIMSWAVINWFMAKRSTGIDTSVLAPLSVRK